MIFTFFSVLFILNAKFSDCKFVNQDVIKLKETVAISNEEPGKPLILTPFILEGKVEEARNLAAVPDELFLGVKSYSGYLTVDKEHNSNSFFWFIPAIDKDYKDASIILWLEGGPGGPSFPSIFVSNGPFITNDEKVINLRNNSWTGNHSVLYIDNPVGTGFSFTDGGWRKNEEEIGNDLYNALIQFFQLFPELQKNDFFISGQSYAGKYVPAVSYRIHKENPKADLKINLKGLLIGNGLIDHINQLNYGDYLYEIGLIDFNMQQEFNTRIKKIKKSINQEKYDDAFNGIDQLILGTKNPTLFKNVTGWNYYQNYMKIPNVDMSYSTFLQQDHIHKAIHVGNKSLDSDNQVLPYLSSDIPKSVAPWFSELLENYRVLLYNGQLDVICNYPGTVNFLRKLNFTSSSEYKIVPRHIWLQEGEVAGYVKEAGLLTEVLVRNAGHLVVLEKPNLALTMISKFVKNLPIY